MSRRVLGLLFPVAVAAALAAPSSSPAQDGAEPAAAPRIDGTVVDREGKPVAGAAVVLTPLVGDDVPEDERPSAGDARTVTADRQGRFTADAGRAPLFLVEATAPGYAKRRALAGAGGLRLELAPAETAEIRGRVTYPDGKPVGEYWLYATSDSAIGWADSTTTARDGSFRIADVEGAAVRIQGRPWDAPPPGPNARPSLSGPFPVGARDLHIVVETGAVVAGRVIDEQGRPVEHACVTLLQNGGEGGAEFRHVGTGPDGSFRILAVRSGVRRLHACREGSQLAPFDSLVSADEEPLVIRLPPRRSIRGVLALFHPSSEGGRVYAARVDVGRRLAYGFLPSGGVDADGRFEVAAPPDDVALFYARPSGVPSRRREWPSTRVGSQAPWQRLRREGGADSLSAVARWIPVEGAHLTGRVMGANGGPAANAYVEIRTHGDDFVWATETAADGTLDVVGSDEGAVCDLRVFHHGHLPVEIVDVATGGEPAQISLRSGARVSGRITAPDGRPIAHAPVEFLDLSSKAAADRSAPEPWDRVAAVTDADGAFEASGLARSRFRVLVTLRAYGIPSERRAIAGEIAAGSTGVDFVLGAPPR